MQKEYEDYINNPPYEYVYYHGYPEKVYYAKLFMSKDGYELSEKSILSNADISVGERNIYTGSDYSETLVATGKNSKFNMGIGKDTIEYETGFKKSTITLNKGESINLKFETKPEFSYKISGKNLILTSSENDVVTLKNYMTLNRDVNVQINGSSIQSSAGYLEMLKADASDFKKGKYNGTVLADDIDASEYQSKNKTGVVIKSKSGDDKVTGSNYNDKITVSSIEGDRTTVIENGGKNTITTGAGRDEISVYNNSSNTIKAGNGKNVITLSSTGKNTYVGGKDRDVVTVTEGVNNINLKDGYNTVSVSNGKNTITGGKNYDKITVSNGVNTINTGDGNDEISLGGGNNTVNSGNGNDKISVSGGNAIVDGGAGDDTYDFMNLYSWSKNEFSGHVDIVDTKGENKILFYEQMVKNGPVVKDGDNVMQMSRISGTTHVYFDVSINKKGQVVMGNDILFTTATEFNGFDDNGVHVVGKNTVSTVEAVGLYPLYYSVVPGAVNPLDPEEPYERPNFGQSASAKYKLDYSELTEKVANWLTSDSNTSGYKSAMEVFTKGNETEIAELTAIYTANSDSCFIQAK